MEMGVVLACAGILLLLVLAIGFVVATQGYVRIHENEVGIVIKKIGRPLPPGRIIALYGEAGVQADILAPGIHWGYWPFIYEIRKVSPIKVPPGQIALVYAKDGAPLPGGRQLGRVVDCENFQDAGAFLRNGGERGKQLDILRAGEYRINTELFTVITAANVGRMGSEVLGDERPGSTTLYNEIRIYDDTDIQNQITFYDNSEPVSENPGIGPKDFYEIVIPADKIGIVTTLDGNPLPDTERAGSKVAAGHQNFQNPQTFIDGGGCKGLQEEFISAGSYGLNPWFVKVEQVPVTHIPTGTVGVVISSVGKTPDNQVPGTPVERGYKGVWKTPLYPGQHPINTEVMNVAIVPTSDIALDWSNKEKPSTNYDAKLKALKLRSNDGFLFEIQVTQVINITGDNAPTMISRIGSPEIEEIEPVTRSSGTVRYTSIRNLVTKVLEPMVTNYFRNSAQDYEALGFHTHRKDRQREAKEYIKRALGDFGVQTVDTFINEIDLPDELEEPLKALKTQEMQAKALEAEQKAEVERQKQAHAKAMTDIQPDLVRAQQGIEIARFDAQAEIEKAKAEAEAIRQRGQAEADALRGQVEAVGGPDAYQRLEWARQIPNFKMPEIWIGQNADMGQALLGLMMGGATGQQQGPQINIDNFLAYMMIKDSDTHQRLLAAPNNQDLSEAQIEEVLKKTYPLYLQYLRDNPPDSDISASPKMLEGGPSRTSQELSGEPSPPEENTQPFLADKQVAEGQIQWYIDIRFPEQCYHNQTVALSVQLTNSAPDASPSLSQVTVEPSPPQWARKSAKLDVTISAKAFEIDDPSKEMALPLDADSEQVRFELTPTKLGQQEIELKFYHGSAQVGAVITKTEVVEAVE